MRMVIKISRILNNSYVLVPLSVTEHILVQISKWGGQRLIPAVSGSGQGGRIQIAGLWGGQVGQADEYGAGGPDARRCC